MKRATVIIGAGFGDEGKGVLTDYFAAKHEKATVVRFNGGAQSGHTVVTPGGRRHVFHHFGAGTLAGADTYLSENFIVNPFLWRKEARELLSIGVSIAGKVRVAPTCRVTTPWDMLVNQTAENRRSAQRHGSCGIGIYETVKRNHQGVWLDALEFRKPHKIDIPQLKKYSLGRLSEIGIDMSPEMREIFDSEEVVKDFLSAGEQFFAEVRIEDRCFEDTIEGDAIFEGAQGLLLDENRKDFFPNLTPSKTGLHNVVWLAPLMGITDLDVVYVTRAYATRHGAGSLPHEDPSMLFSDSTNAPNDFQGSLRFAPLDLDLIGSAICDDFSYAKAHLNVSKKLAITCMDQVPDDLEFYAEGRKQTGRKFLTQKARELISPSLIFGCGPTREDIR